MPSYAQNHDIIGAMKSWWIKSGTWDTDTNAAFPRTIGRTRHLDTYTCFPLQGELTSWLPLGGNEERKEQDGCLVGGLLEKTKSWEKKKYMRLFKLEQLTEMIKSWPHPCQALQITCYLLKSSRQGHRQLSGSWNILRADLFSEGGGMRRNDIWGLR